jgi:hypothetical protein
MDGAKDLSRRDAVWICDSLASHPDLVNTNSRGVNAKETAGRFDGDKNAD